LRWEISLRVESHPESLRVARRLVHSIALLAGASGSEASEIELATGEALSNAHRYAYPGGVGPVEVDVQALESELAVTVHNSGREVSPPTVPATLPGYSSAGGRGLYLISQIMDRLEVGIDRQGHGVVLRMARRLAHS
jgi:serine/threonine-protein kinase RsbW